MCVCVGLQLGISDYYYYVCFVCELSVAPTPEKGSEVSVGVRKSDGKSCDVRYQRAVFFIELI